MKIAIFASGSGTNTENIIRFFENHKTIKIALVLTNNPKAKVIHRVSKFNIKTIIFSREDIYENGIILKLLLKFRIKFIVLAGFLWIIPKNIIDNFPFKIINIHPALLPKFSGKGMYGMKIHRLVTENKEKESGITIHFVNEEYDKGQIIFQKSIFVQPNESADELAERIHKLEYKYYPKIIEKLILNQ